MSESQPISLVNILTRLSTCPPVVDLFFADSPALLIDGDSGAVTIANPAAAAMLRASSITSIVSGSMALRGPGANRLTALAQADDLSQSPRLEMLRFFIGTRTVTLPFMCQRAAAPAPQPNVFAIAAAPPDSMLTIADKAALAFDDDSQSVVVFDRAGELVYTNPAAKAAGDIAPADQLGALEGITRHMLDDGDLVLFSAAPGTALVPQPEHDMAHEPVVPDISALPERRMPSGPAPVGGAAREIVSGLAGARGVALPEAATEAAAATVATAPAQLADVDRDPSPRAAVPGSRFRFALNADALITEASPELSELGLAGEIGESLDDLLTGDLSDFVRAIESRDTFNAVEVLWYGTRDGDAYETMIAGLPILDGRGGYEGLRGFAVIGERRSVAAPMAQLAMATGSDDDALIAPDPYVEDDEPVDVMMAESGETADIQPQSSSASILRRLASGMGSYGAGTSRSDDEATDTEPVVENDVRAAEEPPAPRDIGDTLDEEDRRAFAEIADRLHGEDDDDMPAAPEDEPVADETVIETERAPDDLPPPRLQDDTPVSAPDRKLSRGRARDVNDFVALIERLPVGLMFVRDEKPLFANRAMLDLFGYADLDDLEIAGGLHALFENLSNAREPGKRTLAGITRDGMPIELDARLQLAPWIDGPALLLSARERLVSDADTAADLEAEVVELKDILDTATDGIVLLDASGDILSMNRSAEALFGRDSREASGASFESLFSGADAGTVRDYLAGLKDNGVASVLNDGREITAIERSGGTMPLFLTIGPVGIGSREKYCAVLRDITHWKRTEEELRAARKSAEDTASQKSDVLAKVSHEVRTPLNAIIGFADVMLEEQYGPIGNERYRGYLQDIKASGEHIISLVNDLLDLSKVEAGMMDMDFSQVRLNDIVEQCAAIMQGQANRERVILRTSLAASLPDIVADVRSIRQILLNLISNAVKFTPEAGQVIVSTVYTQAGEVQLRVRDTGLGMSPDDIEQALEPYRQSSTAQADRSGTGIGLPLTKALTEANRASFVIESKLDSGTLVQITFPSTRVLAE